MNPTLSQPNAQTNSTPTGVVALKSDYPITKAGKSVKSVNLGKPIRLVDTKDLSHQEWLDVRKQGIGSSDAPTVCGVNPYMSQLELWLIKTGRIEPAKVSTDGYAPLYWGKQLEPLVAKYYTAKTGNKVRRVNAVLQHPEHEFMLANLDYAVSNPDVGVLEIKTTGIHGAKLWQKGVPLYVACQVQHQLAVTGKQLAHVCVLLGGHEAKLFEVKRDDVLIEQIIKQERQFWQYVKDDIAPPADGSESAQKALQALYPNGEGEIDFSDNLLLNDCFNELLEQKRLIDEHQARFDYLKQQLCQAMNEHDIATFAHGSISWKKSKDSVSLDSKALLKDKPELLEQYPQIRQGSRRFVINHAK